MKDLQNQSLIALAERIIGLKNLIVSERKDWAGSMIIELATDEIERISKEIKRRGEGV